MHMIPLFTLLYNSVPVQFTVLKKMPKSSAISKGVAFGKKRVSEQIDRIVGSHFAVSGEVRARGDGIAFAEQRVPEQIDRVVGIDLVIKVYVAQINSNNKRRIGAFEHIIVRYCLHEVLGDINDFYRRTSIKRASFDPRHGGRKMDLFKTAAICKSSVTDRFEHPARFECLQRFTFGKRFVTDTRYAVGNKNTADRRAAEETIVRDDRDPFGKHYVLDRTAVFERARAEIIDRIGDRDAFKSAAFRKSVRTYLSHPGWDFYCFK